jgi:hypothetical protein
VQIIIAGTTLPGRDCGAADNFPGYSNIHVGVQFKSPRTELLGIVAADAKGQPLCARVLPPTIDWSSR